MRSYKEIKTKFKPILFSVPMIQAILSGQKKQTRRIIKNISGECMFCGCTDGDCSNCIEKTGGPCSWVNSDETICSACIDFPTDNAKYQIDDILWVRETFYIDYKGITHYKTDPDQYNYAGLWKPSIYMPKTVARIFLRVEDVSAEYIQDISDKDAIAEGIEIADFISVATKYYKNYIGGVHLFISPKKSFETLWISINGRQAWDENPLVWTYKFSRLEMADIDLDTFLN